MRGRQVFMESLRAHGVSRIFGNPGTTESPLFNTLPDYPDLTYIVALHEGVAVGAASFYAQASGKTPVVNLHVAPGLGNAIGMIYGALKANSPMLVTAGQQDTRMRLEEPLLGHDLAAMAAPVTKWSAQAERADELGPILRRAFKLANDPPRGPVFVALPIDVMEQETTVAPATAGALWRAGAPDAEGLMRLVELIFEAERPAIVAGDDVARAGAVQALLRLAEAMGAGVHAEGLRHQVSFPTRHPNARPALPLDAASIRNALGDADLVLLLGGPFFEEVWFAASRPFPDGARVAQLEETPARLAFNHALDVGLVGALEQSLAGLADAIRDGAANGFHDAAKARNRALAALNESEAAEQKGRAERAWNRRPMSMARAMSELSAAAPAGTVVVDESITANIDLARSFTFEKPGDYYSGRGGGIGQGLAGAIGVKVAEPGRPVLCISGDGSAMYSIQALWTAAHHRLGIVFVVLANAEYRVLKHNLDTYRHRFDAESNQGYPHMDLTAPGLGFVDMARGMGVAGVRIEDPDTLGPALAEAFAAAADGAPRLVEIAIEGKR